MTSSPQQAVGARVKFRDDHPEYPGMVGTVDADLTLPGGEPMVSVTLDAVPATTDEIEPFSDQEEWPCCVHCGPSRSKGTPFGYGGGHEQPCEKCQSGDPFDPMGPASNATAQPVDNGLRHAPTPAAKGDSTPETIKE